MFQLKKLSFILLNTLFLISLFSCKESGSGEGLDADGNPINDVTDTVVCGSSGYISPLNCENFNRPFDSSFSIIAAEIFDGGTIQNSCTSSSCHSGPSPEKGMTLEYSAGAHSNIVNTKSREIGSLCRIKPGFPDDSYLIMKLENAPQILSAQMPRGGPYLTDDEICVVREWVTNGARND